MPQLTELAVYFSSYIFLSSFLFCFYFMIMCFMITWVGMLNQGHYGYLCQFGGGGHLHRIILKRDGWYKMIPFPFWKYDFVSYNVYDEYIVYH